MSPILPLTDEEVGRALDLSCGEAIGIFALRALARIERDAALLAACRDALEYYADKRRYRKDVVGVTEVGIDGGSRASTALARLEGK